MKALGFIGLGIMGKLMATDLPRGGHRLFVHDIHPAPRGARGPFVRRGLE